MDSVIANSIVFSSIGTDDVAIGAQINFLTFMTMGALLNVDAARFFEESLLLPFNS